MNTASQESSCIVDKCRLEDFDQVLQLLQQLWPEKPLNPVVLRAMFDRVRLSSSQIHLCAKFAGRVIGFGSLTVKCNLWQEGDLGYIDEFVVDSGSRRKGVGTALLARLVAIAKERGCKCVELDTASHREETMAFYHAAGFTNRAFLLTKKI